eukprot:SAG31_NODE_2593_length_5423_cov_21.402705_4_plen_286_part_00
MYAPRNPGLIEKVSPCRAERAAAADGQRLVVFAMDLLGHGKSSWLPGGYYTRGLWATQVAQTMDALRWDRCVLMGHSLGQGVVSLAAATWPHRCAGCVLIEGFGWWDAGGNAGTESDLLARDVALIDKMNARADNPKSYADIDAAVAARKAAARQVPGMYITDEVAAALVRRGTLPHSGGQVKWSHDVRIQTAVMHGMPKSEARSYMPRLPRTLLLHCDPDKTYPGIPERTATRRHLLGDRLVEHLLPESSHHLHADRPLETAALIVPWLLAEPPHSSAALVPRL